MSEMIVHRVQLRLALTPVRVVNGSPVNPAWSTWLVTDEQLPVFLEVLDANHAVPCDGWLKVDDKVVR